jgi:hypothetical protein
VCVRFSVARNFVVVLCQQLEEEEKNERDTNGKKKKKKKKKENHHQIDDHISVVEDTVCDCLLQLDISHSRHVLGKHRRKRDDTQKAGANVKKRRLRKKVRDYGRSLLSQRERGRGGITKKRIIPFHFSST